MGYLGRPSLVALVEAHHHWAFGPAVQPSTFSSSQPANVYIRDDTSIHLNTRSLCSNYNVFDFFFQI
jgi:hypothetical protein